MDIAERKIAALEGAEAAAVFSSYGMGCIHCLLAHQETVEEAAAAHGVDLDVMLAQLNA